MKQKARGKFYRCLFSVMLKTNITKWIIVFALWVSLTTKERLWLNKGCSTLDNV